MGAANRRSALTTDINLGIYIGCLCEILIDDNLQAVVTVKKRNSTVVIAGGRVEVKPDHPLSGTIQQISLTWMEYKTQGYIYGTRTQFVSIFKLKFFNQDPIDIISDIGFSIDHNI